MEEKLELLRKNSLLELQTWAGLSPTPGVSGVIVTNDKKIYYYHRYNYIAPSYQDMVTPEGLSEGVVLSDNNYNKLIKYIEKNIIGKSFKDQIIFDASWHVFINYYGKKIVINNYPEINSELNKIIGGK